MPIAKLTIELDIPHAQSLKDRRQDFQQRLRHAVKKAHDPVFAIPKLPRDPRSIIPKT